MFRRFGNTLARFMYGRYGSDRFNRFLLVLYLIFWVLSVVFRGWTGLIFYALTTVTMVWTLFRMLSRNCAARRAENAKFLKLVGPVMRWYRLRRTILRDKEHRYFKCPKCGQQLRVPQGKGKITVHCRGCGASFQEKS